MIYAVLRCFGKSGDRFDQGHCPILVQNLRDPLRHPWLMMLASCCIVIEVCSVFGVGAGRDQSGSNVFNFCGVGYE